MNNRLVITTDQKPSLVNLVRRLPAILCGKMADQDGIAHGFRNRLGFAILSLIGPNMEEMSRGMPGADGTKWPPLSPEYLAYGRRFGKGEKAALKREAGLTREHKHGPGGNLGLLTPEQVKLWNRTFARALAKYILQASEQDAKAHAAAVAWIVVKKAGGKTKLEVFGKREAQILVDTGYLFNSLQPGILIESTGPGADYLPPGGKGGQEQVFDVDSPYVVVVGSHVSYAAAHHNAKNPKRRRRLWPQYFPSAWWEQIIGVTIQGLQRISDLYRNQQGGV